MENERFSERSELIQIYPIRAIIFDFDGLMVNSEKKWIEASIEYCKEFGIEFPPEYNIHVVGHTDIPDIIDKLLSIQVNQDLAREKFRNAFLKVTADGLEPMPGLREVIEFLSPHYALGIASSAEKSRIIQTLSRFGISHRFETIISREDVNRVKPYPDVYQEASRRIGIAPAHCIAFEDSPPGIASARSAGMRTVAVPNQFILNHDYSEASAIIPTLLEVNDGLLSYLGQIQPPSPFFNT